MAVILESTAEVRIARTICQIKSAGHARIQGLPPGVDVMVINRDGTMSTSDGTFGTGHGVWHRLGASEFAFKFKIPILANNVLGFPPGSMLTTTGTATVEKGGATASGPYSVVIRDAFGGFIFGFDGDTVLTRISIDSDD